MQSLSKVSLPLSFLIVTVEEEGREWQNEESKRITETLSCPSLSFLVVTVAHIAQRDGRCPGESLEPLQFMVPGAQSNLI